MIVLLWVILTSTDILLGAHSALSCREVLHICLFYFCYTTEKWKEIAFWNHLLWVNKRSKKKRGAAIPSGENNSRDNILTVSLSTLYFWQAYL